MDKYYKLHVAGLERDLPLCRVNDSLYIAAFIMLGDTELAEKCAAKLLESVPEYDYIITAECKGIPLAHEMARLAGNTKYFVARKGSKLYMKDEVRVSVKSITTAQEQTLILDRADAEMMNDKKILIVDDVISTGESLNALENIVTAVGGKVVGKAFVLAEGDASTRDDITFLERLPLFDGACNEML